MFNNTVKHAKEITGGGIVAGNSKMPGATYATDPYACNTGSKLRAVEGTTCAKCYACKLAAFRPSVAKGYANRQAAFEAACLDYASYGQAPAALGSLWHDWVEAMAFMINRHAKRTGEYFFRWFDAGDLPHQVALELIHKVARRTPEVQHWVPTREARWLSEYYADGLASNLVVRLSATKVDGAHPTAHTHTSGVHKNATPDAWVCPASQQGGECKDCRACWSKDVKSVSYPLH